jgi:pullulanase
MTTTADIQKNLAFIDTRDENLVAYTLNGAAVGDSWKRIVVAYNGKDKAQDVKVPDGNWKIVLNGGVINTEGLGQHSGGKISVARNAALILVEE